MIEPTSQANVSHADEWHTPSFIEIRMDAEIGAYQEDGPDPEYVVESPRSPRRT